MSETSKKAPWYPNRELTYGMVYFYIKNKTHSLNAFDTESIREAKRSILEEARDASPSHQMFLKAAKLATGISHRTIKRLLYQDKEVV